MHENSQLACGTFAGASCALLCTVNTSGQVVYRLKHPFDDGTTSVVFSPEDFIARLASLVPRPCTHLTRYHGVLAPNSPFRRAVVPTPGPTKRRSSHPKTSSRCPGSIQPSDIDERNDQPLAPLSWAERLKRVFDTMGPPPDNCVSLLRRQAANHSRCHRPRYHSKDSSASAAARATNR